MAKKRKKNYSGAARTKSVPSDHGWSTHSKRKPKTIHTSTIGASKKRKLIHTH